jgi:hypothetical protein
MKIKPNLQNCFEDIIFLSGFLLAIAISELSSISITL